MNIKEKKKISCKRCQIRKLRCSRTDPCISCLSAKQKCEYRENDVRRRPVAHEYVTLLENRVAWLESFFNRLKQASSDERDAMLSEVSFGDHLQPEIEVEDTTTTTTPIQRQSNLQIGAEGALIYHGPTSILQLTQNSDTNLIGMPSASMSYSTRVAQHFDLQDAPITQALQDFFKWQYPHFMFIYREAFLRDHYSNQYNGKYCSPPLLYALCALGTLMSTDQPEPDMSERFFAEAESILMVSGLNQPCITNVQAFLCMAFYEMGRGNLSKGWAFSGIAFRMGYDIGFQRDPQYWISTDRTIATPEDLEIRRRIYWGCYLSDKLISLILGRTTYLHDNDASVDPTTKLPDLPEMTPWLSAGFEQDYDVNISVDTLNSRNLVPSFQSQINLAKLIQNMLTKLFSIQDFISSSTKRAWLEQTTYLDILNLDFCRWQESLPNSLRWNKWESTTTPLLPHVAALHILFNSLKLCLNLDFAVADKNAIERSRTICLSSIDNIIALVRKFNSQHGLNHAPLIFVYGIVQAASAVSVLNKTTYSIDHVENQTSVATGLQLDFLLKALNDCSIAWKLASQAKISLLRSIGRDEESSQARLGISNINASNYDVEVETIPTSDYFTFGLSSAFLRDSSLLDVAHADAQSG